MSGDDRPAPAAGPPDDLVATIAEIANRLETAEEAIEKLSQRIRRNRGLADDTADAAKRLAPQVASLEVRLESLRERLEDTFSGTPEDVAIARSVVEEVRQEHERIRVRFSGMAAYEARLARLEKIVEETAPDRVNPLGRRLRQPRKT